MRPSHKTREQQRGRSETRGRSAATTTRRRRGHRRGRQSSNLTAFLWTTLAAYLSVVAFTDSAISSMLFGDDGYEQDPKRAQMRRGNARVENYREINDADLAFLRTGKQGLDSTTKADRPIVHVKRIEGAKAKRQRKQLERDPVAREVREELPPLSSILVNGQVAANANTTALLDYAIIGFAKTGTTSVHRHLATLTHTLDGEHCEMVVNDIVTLIRAIYRNDDHRRVQLSKDGSVEKRMRGIKCPQDIQSSAHNYARYFPETKLLVGIRHPIDWFESLYNYRLSNVPWKEMLPTSNLTRGEELRSSTGLNMGFYLFIILLQVAAQGVRECAPGAHPFTISCQRSERRP